MKKKNNTEYDEKINHDRPYIALCEMFEGARLSENLSFEAQVTIKELYDMDGNKVPKSGWRNHNVNLGS